MIFYLTDIKLHAENILTGFGKIIGTNMINLSQGRF